MISQGLITKKLTRFILLFGSVSALLITLLQVSYDYFSLKENYLHSVQLTVDTSLPAIGESLWNLDFQQARLQLEAINNLPYVSFTKLEMKLFDDIVLGHVKDIDSAMVVKREIVRDDQLLLGKLTVVLDEQVFKTAFWNNFYKHMLNNAMVISITAFILYFFLNKLITHRLYSLVSRLRLMSETDIENADLILSVPANKQNCDEIDELNLAIKKLWSVGQRSLRALRRSEERWRLALDCSSDGLWDWNVKTGEVFYSDNWKSMLGYEEGEIKNNISEWERLAHPDDRERCLADLKAHFAGMSDHYTNTHRMLCKDGSYKWVLDRGRVIQWDEQDHPVRMVGTHTDIHPLVEAENQLKIAAMVYQQATEGMLITNENAEIIDVNQAFTTITGYTAREVKGKKPNILCSGKHSTAFYQDLWDGITSKGVWKGEICNRNKAGQEYIEWLSISEIRDEKRQLIGYVGIFTDITQRKQQEELIYHQANYDALTNLPNRRFFIELLQRKIDTAQREEKVFWLLYLDLDHFKEINDTLGHDYGDELLKQWCQRIKNHLRQSDIFARLGGDEFGIVVGQVTQVTVIDELAQHLLDLLNKPFSIRENEVYVSASIGVVQYPKDGEEHASLLRAADQTLYKAKQLGRNQQAYYTPELQQQLDNKVNLARKIRKGISNNQFEVYYQPIVRLSDNKVFKAEALLRWQDPEEGFISPAQFIPVAEETGLIDSLSEYVVKEVLLKQLTWQKKHTKEMQISINISPIEFRSLQKQKTNWFEELKVSGLMEGSILFEITEGVLIDNNDDVLDQLLEFRDLGIEVAIDDFGTGYSSLAYLYRFHIDYLKIDKQFVDDIVTNPNVRALCEAIIMMAHTLGLKVIAEGVETEQQAKLLKLLNCDFYQGYLCSTAISAQDFEKQFITTENETTIEAND